MFTPSTHNLQIHPCLQAAEGLEREMYIYNIYRGIYLYIIYTEKGRGILMPGPYVQVTSFF